MPDQLRSALRRRRRPLLLLALALGVAALHLLLLGWWGPGRVPVPAPRPVVAVGDATLPEAPPVTQPPPAVPVGPRLGAPALQPAPDLAPRPRPAPAPATAQAPVKAPASAVPGEAAAPRPDAPPVPVYPTQVLPPQQWAVRLQRGALVGEGRLRWAPMPQGRYELVLDARAGPLTLLDWRSSGALDAHGLAPERFVDKRRGRAAQAANFDRAGSRITYSGAAGAQPLPAGTQDRLSLLLQLAAIVAADAQQARPGAQMALWVSGARGDADLWRFEVQGEDPLAEADGTPLPALRLQREARHSHDLRVELWLSAAPDRGPLRLRLTPVAGGDALDLRLQPLPE